MSKKDVSFDFSVSQNFLTGTRILNRLLDHARLSACDTVIEIGTGKGHLTRQLAKRCALVKTYEIDPKLCATIREKRSLPENARLYEGDFLRAPLPKGIYKVFANLPFCITTAVVKRLAFANNPPQAAWLVMEKGAALRFAGVPRENRASLALKPFFSVRVVCRIPREEFHPMPGVECALLELVKKQTPDIPLCHRCGFEAFVEQAQARGVGSLLTPRQVSAALKEAGLGPLPPSGNMLYVQWLCLYRCRCSQQR